MPKCIIGCAYDFLTCDEVDDGRFAATCFAEEDDVGNIGIHGALRKCSVADRNRELLNITSLRCADIESVEGLRADCGTVLVRTPRVAGRVSEALAGC